MTVQCSRCQEVALWLIHRYQWHLLSVENLTAQLHARTLQAEENHDKAFLTNQATNLYCVVLYDACGTEGESRERAYLELSHYLYDIAIYKYGDPELAEEFVQEAIFRTFRLLDRCREPGAFLTFATFKLRQAATDYFRKRDREQKRTESLPEAFETDVVDNPTDQLPDLGLPPLEELVISVEWAERILNRIVELIQQQSRAKNQFLAVILKYLYDWSDQEIAQELDTSVSNVHLLRSRGLKRLRDDSSLYEFWDDC
ncbi:MAG: RNA polymerase sigma factor [Chloroflexota bacterium]